MPSLSAESFIGRHEEISTLHDALERAVAGNGGVVMITGEPGIGKTHTVQELSAWAESRGVLVLTGRNSEDAGAPPYWLWIQALRGYRWDERREQLSSALGLKLYILAPLISGVPADDPSGESSTDANAAEQARFRFYDATTRFLVEGLSSEVPRSEMHRRGGRQARCLQLTAPRFC